MPPKPKSVSTAADDLVELVTIEKEIAFKDAAKKLKVPISTIEAWATFLEEDGMLAIKYKLTTPYLTVPSQKNVQKEQKKLDHTKDTRFMYNVKQAEVKSDIEKIAELIDTSIERTSQGEFGMLGQLESDALDRLKKVVEFILSNITLTPQKKAGFSDDVSAIEKKIQIAVELAKQRKFDQANQAYSASQQHMKMLLQKTKESFYERPADEKGGEEGIRTLFEKTYRLLDEGKADEAENNYERIKQMFTALSSKFSTEKSNIQENIIKLNRDLALRTNKIRAQEVTEGSEKIKELVRLADAAMKKKEFNTATAYYVEIKEVFEHLPAGFATEKRRMKENILKVFEKIADERKAKLKKRFDIISRKITEILKDLANNVAAGELGYASAAYKSVTKLYSELPSGFMHEKFEIHKNIVGAYNLLSERLETFAESRMNSLANRIFEGLTTMKQQVNSNALEDAEQSYETINKLFAGLPEGFIEKKTEIQEKIIDTYEELLARKDKTKSQSYKDGVAKIEKLIEEGNKAVAAQNYPWAYALYRRMKSSYIGLQPLDIKKRQEIRNKILLLYRNVLILRSRQESPALPKTVPQTDIHAKINDLKSNSRAKVRVPIT